MPTARELLEQADALMRRNREEAARGVRAPATHEPSAPFVIRAPAPPPASDAAPAKAAPIAALDDAEIPVLEEVVAPPATSPPAADDEFPVLTDAVDEIEVALPVSLEGEPSDWLEGPSDDHSVLGPSPPSVALVPSVATRAAARSESPRVPAHDSPMAVPDLEDFTAADPVDNEAPITVVRSPSAGGSAPVSAPASWIEELVGEAPPIDEDVTIARIPAPAVAEAPAAPIDAEPSPTVAAAPFSPIDEPEVAPEAMIAAEPSPEIAHELPSPVVEPEVAPEATVAAPMPVAEPAPAPPRDESWDALAEEIRMQVLQRIDLFTDTGLRDRLGERLKPIVDRASADLVATINQHVGELLRAYVAEAIEREIDRWRAGR